MTRCLPLLSVLACAPDSTPPNVPGPSISLTEVPWTPDAETRILDFTSEGTDGQAHQWTFHYELDEVAPAVLVCTVPSDSEELHTHEFEPALSGSWTFHGLLADTEHQCGIYASDAEGGSASASLTTPEPLGSLRRWQTEGDPKSVWGHYTMLNQFQVGAIDQVVTVFDPQGRVRWTYAMDEGTSTGLETRYVGDGLFLIGGATNHAPAMVNLAGEVVWQVPEGPDRYHHDAVLTDEGTLLAIVHRDAGLGTSTWTGFGLEEWDVPPTKPLWTWDVQTAVDARQLPPGEGDVYHANAAFPVDDALGPGVIVSMSHLNQLARIDKVSGDVVWTLGVGGSISNASEDWFYGQHAPELDGSRLLLHDNGRQRPEGQWSRLLEYELDQEAGTVEVTWDWREDGWWQLIWGDADRLPDGHVLATRGHCDTCGNGHSQTSSVVAVDPTTNAISWKLFIDDAQIGMYRANRIDGCTLFENQRYCD